MSDTKRTSHNCSSTAIVNHSHFHSCGPVVSTSVTQLNKMCRSVGCHPLVCRSDGLSPRWLVTIATVIVVPRAEYKLYDSGARSARLNLDLTAIKRVCLFCCHCLLLARLWQNSFTNWFQNFGLRVDWPVDALGAFWAKFDPGSTMGMTDCVNMATSHVPCPASMIQSCRILAWTCSRLWRPLGFYAVPVPPMVTVLHFI